MLKKQNSTDIIYNRWDIIEMCDVASIYLQETWSRQVLHKQFQWGDIHEERTWVGEHHGEPEGCIASSLSWNYREMDELDKCFLGLGLTSKFSQSHPSLSSRSSVNLQINYEATHIFVTYVLINSNPFNVFVSFFVDCLWLLFFVYLIVSVSCKAVCDKHLNFIILLFVVCNNKWNATITCHKVLLHSWHPLPGRTSFYISKCYVFKSYFFECMELFLYYNSKSFKNITSCRVQRKIHQLTWFSWFSWVI